MLLSSRRAGFYLKLIFLLHPDKDLVDAVFHAHRLDWVLAGRFYFTQLSTSATPFPYAIGLYVFSAPWSLLTGDHVTLLRVVVCASEAVAGALLYPLILRAWGDRAIGVTAVLLFHLLPLPYAVIGNANLTNAFGQSAALVTMIAAVSWAFERRRGAAVLGTDCAGSAGFSFARRYARLPVADAADLVGALLRGGRSGAYGKPAISVVAATGLALVLAVGLYYGHFGSVYRPHVEKTLGGGHGDRQRGCGAGQGRIRTTVNRGRSARRHRCGWASGAPWTRHEAASVGRSSCWRWRAPGPCW